MRRDLFVIKAQTIDSVLHFSPAACHLLFVLKPVPSKSFIDNFSTSGIINNHNMGLLYHFFDEVIPKTKEMRSWKKKRVNCGRAHSCMPGARRSRVIRIGLQVLQDEANRAKSSRDGEDTGEEAGTGLKDTANVK
jgi:hypothetical protein